MNKIVNTVFQLVATFLIGCLAGAVSGLAYNLYYKNEPEKQVDYLTHAYSTGIVIMSVPLLKLMTERMRPGTFPEYENVRQK